MKSKDKPIPTWALVVFVFLLVVPSLIYFLVMALNKVPLSKDTGDWGAFSDYINPFVGLANSVLLIILTIRLRAGDIERDKDLLKLEKPILSVFRKPNESRYWFKNIGRGSAQNIIVYYDLEDDNITWKREIVFYGLAPNDEQKIVWTYGLDGYAILLCYEDVFNDCYTATLINNKSEIKEYGKQRPQIKANETKHLWEAEPDPFVHDI